MLKFFLPFLVIALSLPAQESTVSDKKDRAYRFMVEAGARLLELDILHENAVREQQHLIETLQQTEFTTTGGNSVNALLSLEKAAHGFDDVIPAFLELQRSVDEVKDNERAQLAFALHGLCEVLGTPEILHTALPLPHQLEAGYLAAMKHDAVSNFVKLIHQVAQKKYVTCSCESIQLTQRTFLFYDVIRQTVSNMFGAFINIKDDVVKAAGENSIAEVDVTQKRKIEDPQIALYRAILNDSPLEIAHAIQAGATTNRPFIDKKSGSFINNKRPLEIAVTLAKSNAVKAIISYGVQGNSAMFDKSLEYGDLKSALELFKGINCTQKDYQHCKAALERILLFADQDLETAVALLNQLILKKFDIDEMLRIAVSIKGCPIELLEFLLVHGANVNYRQRHDFPLFSALIHRNVAAMRFLLNHGADPNQAYPGNGNNFETLLAIVIRWTETADRSSELLEIMSLLKQFGGKASNGKCAL